MPTPADQNIKQLHRQFLDSLPQRAHQLEDLWHHLRYFNWSDNGFKTFQVLIHRLIGSGTSVGLPAVSETAQMLETYLVEHQQLGQPLGGIEYEMIDQMVKTLVHILLNIELNQTQELLPVQHHHDGDGKVIFIVEADHALAALMKAYLEAAKFNVQYFDNAGSCLQQLNVQTPHVLLIDPGITGDLTPAFDITQQIKSRLLQNVPIVFLSARSDMHTRLRALRAGCATYLTKPVDFNSLVKSISQTIEANEITHKVMIVDDEALVAAYHAEILRHAGMEVITVSQPMHSLQRATEFKPDLVILDMHMPDINGIELATLLRQNEEFLLLPIIFVTADTSIKLRQSIESLGVNGVLTKPVDIEALVNACERAISDTHALKSRVESIIQRGQRNNQITRNYFFAAIDNQLQAEHSHKTPTALYHIGLDIEEHFYQHYGPAGVANLHGQFCQRLAHIIGSDEQWSDLTNFVACVLVGKRSHEHHQQRAAQIVAHISDQVFCINDEVFVINAHVGIHYLNTETGSSNAALMHAEQAYEQAKHNLSAQLPIVEEVTQTVTEIDNIGPAIDFNERIPEENLRIAYQPMISLEHANIEHYEALIRWRLNDDELIPAAKFLHYIEHSSMRVDLDRWVLQSAINAIITDNYARENANLFIHLAHETLAQKSFFSFAANVLRSSRLRGQRRLIFIFDDLWVAENPVETRSILNSLHNIQCGACLSHAGASPETQKTLQTMDFDYVRLSPTLTTNPTANKDQELQLLAVINAAKNGGAQIIATQVEDSKNLSTLWIHGVRLFQGFLLQSPDQSLRTHNDMEVIKQFFSPEKIL